MHVTIAELARRLKVSEQFVWQLLDDCKLPAKPGPGGEPTVDETVAEQYIAEAKRRRDKAMDEYMLVSAEQHAVEQLHLDVDEHMNVARRATAEAVARVHRAYEAMYAVSKFVVNTDGMRISAEDQPTAFATEVVARAARALQLSPEETQQAQALNSWGLAGVPTAPPLTADESVQLAERMLAACLGSRGRG